VKIWIINNTKFGYKNNSKEWSKNMFDYFENHFIPFIKKHAKPGDTILHLGNVFNSTETVNIKLLLKVNNLLKELSNIIPDILIIDALNEKINEIFVDNTINKLTQAIYGKICYIPNDKNVLNYINNDTEIAFINSRIDKDLLKKFPNTLFFCGYHDDRNEDKNVITVGSLYQFDNTSIDKGFYVVDSKTKKYQFIKNNYSPKYNTITITNISQIDDIDIDFVNKNRVNVVVDKSLVDDKKLKIDVLLSKYNFKSITYINDVEKVELVDSTSMNMEELIREKIKNSDNPKLLSEFEKIISIFKEKY